MGELQRGVLQQLREDPKLLKQTLTQLSDEMGFPSSEKVRLDLQKPHSHLLRAMAAVIAGEINLRNLRDVLAKQGEQIREAKAIAAAAARSEQESQQRDDARHHMRMVIAHEQKLAAEEKAKADTTTDPWGPFDLELTQISRDRGILMKEAIQLENQQIQEFKNLFKECGILDLVDDAIIGIVDALENLFDEDPTLDPVTATQETTPTNVTPATQPQPTPPLKILTEEQMARVGDTLQEALKDSPQQAAQVKVNFLILVPKMLYTFHQHKEVREQMLGRCNELYVREDQLRARFDAQTKAIPTQQQRTAQFKPSPFFQPPMKMQEMMMQMRMSAKAGQQEAEEEQQQRSQKKSPSPFNMNPKK